MTNKNNGNVINILEEHKVYKKDINDDYGYFGELSNENKPMNIGLIYSKKKGEYGTFIMMENMTGKLSGEGMSIFYDSNSGVRSIGYCSNGQSVGPQLISDKKEDLCYCYLNEDKVKVGFAVDIKRKSYTIYQCFIDGSTSYKCITCKDGVLYFEDYRRRKNKYVKIFEDGLKCYFNHEPLQIDPFFDHKAIMPTKVVKHNAKNFTVSGGVQTYKSGDRIKSEYDDYFKELSYKGSFPDGYGIKYYDNAYFFGQFNSDNKREKVGCLRKNKIAFMGNFYGDALYGPVLTIEEDNVPRLCTYNNGKKHGTYFEDCAECLFIKWRDGETGKDYNTAYKIYLDTFNVEEIDLDTNTVLRSASYPFKDDDKESLKQEEEKNKELEILKSLGLDYDDYEELENFNYVIENNQIKILSLKEATTYLNIPKCAKILADNAFANKSLCKDITTVNMRDGVVEIGENCFVGCERLTKISMGESVKEIKKGAFKGASFERVNFSSSTKIIGAEAFAKCENLYKAYGVANDCKIDPTAFPEWCEIVTQQEIDKDIKRAINGCSPIYKFGDFIAGIFKKKKKKKKITPGEEKKIKEKVEKDNKKKNDKTKEKKVKKEVKRRYKSSFGEKIQDVLRILAFPFIYIGKGIAWLFGVIISFFSKMFKGISRLLSDLEITKEHVLIALPFILLLGYTIFAFIYGVDKLEDLSVTKLIYDGYDWELSGLASNWMEQTDHNFFTAITLGLIQIILIVIGFVLDIVLVAIIFVLGLVLAILAGILKFIVMELLPIAVLAIYLIMLKFVSKSDKGLLITCMILSLVAGVVYYIALLG